MVLENLISAFQAEQKPYQAVFLGFVYTTVAAFLAYGVFKAHASLTMVFLATMAALPLIYQMTVIEEEKDLEGYDEGWLLKEHSKALRSFIWLFVGMSVSFALWYSVLPGSMTAQLFSSQQETINALNGKATGFFTLDIGTFTRIFLNNVRVLVFCILFSFLYGAGAIFILAWNASIIGAAMGNIVRTGLAQVSEATGVLMGHFQIVTYALLRYVIHGIPEIAAYFVAGLAGGIISIAVIRHEMGTQKFQHVLLDSTDLLLISLLLVFVAGVLEVWVTPIFF
jgi:uncharacterized membrane protein SpoIIM required for sporulation